MSSPLPPAPLTPYPEPTGPPTRPSYVANYPLDRGQQIREWLDMVYRGRWYLLASLVLATAAAVAYALWLPNQYRASTLVLVETDTGTDLSSVLPTDASQAFSGEDRALENELFVLRQSDLMQARTAERLVSLAGTPVGERLTILKDEEGRTLGVEEVAERLPSYLTFATGGTGVDAVSITATSTVPTEAALIANLYAEAYLARTRESSRATMTATRDFLTGQVDSLAGELTSREEAVRAYMTREGAVRLDEAADRLVSQIALLQAERDEARISADMRGASAEALRRELTNIEPQLAARLAAGTDAEIAAIQSQILALQTEIETIYSRNPGLRDNPTSEPELTRRLRAVDQLSERARDLAQESMREALATGGVSASTEGVGRLVDLRRRMIDTQIEQSGFEAKAASVAARMAEYESQLSRIPTQSVELARLTRDRQSTENLAVALQGRLQEARVAEQSELGYAEVIAEARRPDTPFAPSRKRIVLLGMLFGLGLGLSLAMLRTRLDHRIHRPDDLRDRGLTVLGVVPSMVDVIKEEFKGQKTIDVGGRQVETGLISLLSPMSQASENFRAIRTSVQFSRPDAHVRTIVVTSASPGEGKTTISSNLAVTLAQANRRVLLVDADLRRPRQHGVFGVSKSPGLSDELFAHGDAKPPREIAEDMWLQPAGRSVPNPSEVLSSAAMRDHLIGWHDTYDLVILDAPPVLAATDAVLLSTQADAVIVVARAGKTKDFELEHAIESLRAVGAPIIGIVLNDFDASHAYGYKYRYTAAYRQTYSYGHSDAQSEFQSPS